MSSLKPPVIKLDSIRYHFYNVQSTLSSGWQALRKIRCVPRLAANGSFSRQSLAYVHASSQYIKQVSGLLKTGVTSLRSSSSSYDTMQGIKVANCMLYCYLSYSSKRNQLTFAPPNLTRSLPPPPFVGSWLFAKLCADFVRFGAF